MDPQKVVHLDTAHVLHLYVIDGTLDMIKHRLLFRELCISLSDPLQRENEHRKILPHN